MFKKVFLSALPESEQLAKVVTPPEILQVGGLGRES